jgi:hypothetical protein
MASAMKKVQKKKRVKETSSMKGKGRHLQLSRHGYANMQWWGVVGGGGVSIPTRQQGQRPWG